MPKTVKIDDRNRIHITTLKELTKIDFEEKKQVAIHPNAITGLIYDPDSSYDDIINSLKSHIHHFENLKNNEENNEVEE